MVAINVAPIVLALIPGYVVQAAAGCLANSLWGGIWGGREAVTHSTGTVVWFIILAMPTGDRPCFMARLSHVSFVRILLLTLLIRVPTDFLVAAAGAGVWAPLGWQLGLLRAICWPWGTSLLAAVMPSSWPWIAGCSVA